MSENIELTIRETKLSKKKFLPFLYLFLLIDFLWLILIEKIFDNVTFIFLAFVFLTVFFAYSIFFKKCKVLILDLRGIQVDDHLFTWEEIFNIKYHYGHSSVGDSPSRPKEMITFQAYQNNFLYRFNLSNGQDIDVRKIDSDEFKQIKTKIDKVFLNLKTDNQMINFQWSSGKYILASLLFSIYLIFNLVGIILFLKYTDYISYSHLEIIFSLMFLIFLLILFNSIDYFSIPLSRYKLDAFNFNLFKRIFISAFLALLMTFSLSVFYNFLNFNNVIDHKKIDFEITRFELVAPAKGLQGYEVKLKSMTEESNVIFQKAELFLPPLCKKFLEVGKKTSITFFKGKLGSYFTNPQSYEKENCGIK